ncbi:hypothetical protein [Embleya sp. NBC_00896]|uniref:hypothetical protein n=1 Tax=Embleya sp. NBC_00896 TaxID=2975961 RepID=UPI00386C7DF1|nr:hypothetical protein OG928_18970 [Embleya sp. NBC_00896]
MAFSAHEVRILRRALAVALRGGRDSVDFWLLGRAIGEAQDERERLRAFMTAELRRYRAALPGAASTFLACLRNAVDEVAHVPSAEDLAALRITLDLPCGERERASRAALLRRCTRLAEAALEQRLTDRARRRAAAETARAGRVDPLDILIPARPRPTPRPAPPHIETAPAPEPLTPEELLPTPELPDPTLPSPEPPEYAAPAAPEELAAREELAAPEELAAREEPAAPEESAAREELAVPEEPAAHEELAAPEESAALKEPEEPEEPEEPAAPEALEEHEDFEEYKDREDHEDLEAPQVPEGPREFESEPPTAVDPEPDSVEEAPAEVTEETPRPEPARESLSPVIPHRRQGRILGQLPVPEILQAGTG